MKNKSYFHVHIGCPVLKDLELGRLSELGHELLIIDDVGLQPKTRFYNTYLHESFDSPERIANLILEFEKKSGLRLGHVFTLAEGSVDFTNSVLRVLRLPVIFKTEVTSIRDKFEMRKRLQSAGQQIPVLLRVENKNEIPELSSESFPVIVKPVDSMESRSVSFVVNNVQLKDACARVFTEKTVIQGDKGPFAVEDVYALKPHAVVESYFDGYEYSVEVLVIAGRVKARFITFKRNSGPPFFYENGHTSGLEPLRPAEDAELTNLVSRLIAVNQFDCTLLHIEFRVTPKGEVALIECNSRLAGDQISVLIEKAYGINLLSEFLKRVVTCDSSELQVPAPIITTRYYLSTERQGTFRRNTDSVAGLKINWWLSDGAVITHFQTEGVSRVGSIEFQSKSTASLSETVSAIVAEKDNLFQIVTKSREGLDLSRFIRRQVSRWYFFTVGVIAIIIALASGFTLWKSQQQSLIFFGRSLTQNIMEAVVSREILPIAQKISDLGLRDWCKTITVTDAKYSVIYSTDETGLPSSLVFRNVDPNKFEFQFPIQADGIVYGHLLFTKNNSRMLASIVFTLALILVAMATLFVLVIKFILPRAFLRAETGIKRMADLLNGLEKELVGIGAQNLNRSLVLESYRAELDALPTEFAEVITLRDVTRNILNALNRVHLEIGEKQRLSKEVETLSEKATREEERQRILQEFAAQVAHDIRSPLAALDMVNTMAEDLPEDLRILIRQAIGRIRDIANGLSSRNAQNPEDKMSSHLKLNAEPIRQELLSSAVETIITEKRIQHKKSSNIEIICDIDDGAYGSFANVQPAEFKRVLSNLIDNSVESLMGAGKIKVLICREGETITIKVIDTGRGMAPELIPEVTKKGVSFGKATGTGLGLYHAKTRIEAWRGLLGIESKVGAGTTVEIKLPAVNPPAWFKASISIKDIKTIVILDDDSSIHSIWAQRMAAIAGNGRSFEVQHFYDGDSLRRWIKGRLGSALYLADYELIGQKDSGLDLIEELGISASSILVTSHFHESHVRARCERLGVSLIPKELAPYIPIQG